MNRTLVAAVLAILLFAPSMVAQSRVSESGDQAANADSQSVHERVITVSRSGEAFAKPDVGILIMSIRSSSPIADEAVAENGRKAKAVESALAHLGFAPGAYQLSSAIIGQAGGPRFPGQPDITAYDAVQYVYVFFEGADLTDVAHLTERSGAVIEALRKAGAVPANAGGPQFGPVVATAQGALIIYTIKDASQYEHQALQVAIGRARDAAQDIATAAGVQITGLRNVKSGYLSGNVMPRSGPSPLEGLRYRWLTTKIDELQIIANATLEFDFK